MNTRVPAIKGLLRAAAEVLIGRASVAILSLMFLAYFARELPKEVFGLLALHAALAAASAVVLNLGLHFAVIRIASPLFATGRQADAVNGIVGPASLVRLVATVLLVSVFLVLATRIASDVGGMNIGFVLPFIAGHLVAKNLHHILTSIFHARQQYFTASFMDSLAAVSEKTGAFCLYLMFGTEYFFVGFMIGQAVVTLICLLIQIPILTQGTLRQFSWSAANPARYRAQYTRVLARDGFQQLDRLLVGALFSLGELAYYHLARQIAVTLKVLVRAFVDPITVRLAHSLSNQEIARDRRRILLISATLPVGMALLSPFLIVAVGGDSFSVAAPLLALLALSYLFYGASEFNLAVLNICGRGDLRASHELATAAIGIATTYTMASLVGIMGVPAGQFTAFILLWLNSRGQSNEMLLGRQSTADRTLGALDAPSANQSGATP